MIIKEGPNSVEVTVSGPQAGTSDRRATVNVALPHFTGTIETWFSQVDWDGFLGDLRELERARQGKAQLSADDPREFEITIASTDRSGHMAVTGHVGRADGSHRTSLGFGFAFDVSTLPKLLRQAELHDAAV